MKKVVIAFLILAAMSSVVLFGFEVYGWFIPNDLSDSARDWRKTSDWLLRVSSVFLIIYQIGKGRQPTKTYVWILLFILIPSLGVLAYLLFGYGYGKNMSLDEKLDPDLETLEAWREPYVRTDEEDDYLTEQELPWLVQKSVRLLESSHKSLFYRENELKVYHWGQPLFEDMLDDFRRAEHHIHCEHFIWLGSRLADEMLEIFAEKIQHGVTVRVLYDAVGSRAIKKEFIRRMEDLGVEVRPFMKFKWWKLNGRVNYRNHRKIVVVDGKIAYTGGYNVDDKYRDGDPELGPWRDTHLRIVGDGARGLQYHFLMDWRYQNDDEFSDPADLFPEDPTDQKSPLHIAPGGGDTEVNGIEHSLLSLIGTAREYIYLTTPYLVPPQDFIETMKVAGRAGIDFRIVIPETGDFKVVDYCNRAYVQELLEIGVRVYLYRKGFIHAKVMIVDDAVASVGSANLDVRSLEQNFEINTLLYGDNPIIPELKRQFFRDLEECREVKLEEWKQRSRKSKALEALARLAAPLF